MDGSSKSQKILRETRAQKQQSTLYIYLLQQYNTNFREMGGKCYMGCYHTPEKQQEQILEGRFLNPQTYAQIFNQ